jgi:hypothetical protein
MALWRRIAWFGGAIAGALTVTVGGLVYFSSALPNTYYAKDMSLGRSLSDGLGYLIKPGTGGAAPPAIPNVIWAFVLLVEVGFFVLGVVAISRRFPRCWYLVAIVAGQTLYILKSGGDWMPGGRFIAVMVIPLVVVDVIGLVAAVLYLRQFVTGSVARCFMPLGAAAVAAASFLPLVVVRAPVWSLGSISDSGLVATAPLPSFAPRIAIRENLPKELSCLHSGQLVATSEIGYLGFVRLDLRILDLRGLVDRTIARHSPQASKYPWGVHERDLFHASSVVGAEILRQRPAVIATFDGVSGRSVPRMVVLGGRYRLVKSIHFGTYILTYYSRSRDLDSCLRRM